MRLTVIGASAACPNPGGASSSYLVEHDDFSLVLDCGPGSVPMLRRFVTLRSVGAIVVSHLHSDHTIDLVPFRYGLRYIPGGRGPAIPLWLPPGGENFLARLENVFAIGSEADSPFFSTEFEIAEYDPESTLTTGPFEITFAPTRHFIDCWAIRVEGGGRSVVYLADSSYDEALVEFARGADLLVCEATMPAQPPEAPPSDGHLTAAEAGRLATNASVRHLLLTHMWIENGFATAAAEARTTFEGAISIAETGVLVQV